MRLKLPDDYFQNETRCDFYVTAMMKRLWAVQMDILSWIDEVCRANDISYIMCWGSLLGAVRHKGYIPWDDDIDKGMLRSDYEKLLGVVEGRIPSDFTSKTLLPGASPPKEMIFSFDNGTKLNTSPEFLKRFYGCPYATGVDIYVFDKIPTNPQDYAYQDRLLRMLDRLLILQRGVDSKQIDRDEEREYRGIISTIERELEYTFDVSGNMSLQIVTLIDIASALCEDCDSDQVEIRQEMLYKGNRNIRIDYFTKRIWVPFENVLEVPIPEKYHELLSGLFGDWRIPKRFESMHPYPIYYEQRNLLYKLYNEHGWEIPEEFLEYDENGNLIVDPKSL